MPALRPVTHCIFDVDGLLLDTERLYTVAIQQVCNEFSKEYTWDIKVKCMGTKGEIGAQTLIDSLNLPITVTEYFSKIQMHYDILFPQAVLLPGVNKLITHLLKHNIPIAIASGGAADTFKLKTKNHREFFKLFHHSVFASSDPEVKNGKPAPDVFLLAAERFEDGPNPDKCLVFEDAPNGVESALAAGMQVVAVPDDRLDRNLIEKATLILRSLEEFKPEDFGLPPFSN